MLEEPLGAVRSEVEEASSQKVRVGARRGRGGFLPFLPLLILAFLLQGQRGQGHHAAGQGGELRLAALAVVLPGLEGRDRVWREEERRRERASVSRSTEVSEGGREEAHLIPESWWCTYQHTKAAWEGEGRLLSGYIQQQINFLLQCPAESRSYCQCYVIKPSRGGKEGEGEG